MGIQIDGIVSGLDTTAMVDALVDVAALPLNSLESKVDSYESSLEGVSGLINRLNDFVSVSEGLDTESELAAMTAFVSDEGAMVVEATSEALTGSYSVTVDSLAVGDTHLSTGFVDSESLGVVAQGTMTVEVDGVSTDIVIDSSSDSLEMVAQALNEVDGVVAYIITFEGTSNPYRLIIQSEETGLSNGVNVDTSGLTGPGETLGFVRTVAASNASVTINGFSYSSETNTISELLPGLELTLTQATGVAFDLTVSVDSSTTIESITAIIDAYNEIVNYYNVQTVYDPDSGMEGDLVGESGARRVMDGIASTMSGGYTLDGIYDSLGAIGITTNTSDGTLSIDTDKLDDALSISFDDVIALFTSDDGPLATIRTKIEDMYVDEDSGTLGIRQESIERSLEDYEDQIADFELYLKGYEEHLRARFTAMEVILGQLEAAQTSLMALIGSD